MKSWKKAIIPLLVVIHIFSQQASASCAPDHEGECNDTDTSGSSYQGEKSIIPATIIVGLGLWLIFGDTEKEENEVITSHFDNAFKRASLSTSGNEQSGLSLQVNYGF